MKGETALLVAQTVPRNVMSTSADELSLVSDVELIGRLREYADLDSIRQTALAAEVGINQSTLSRLFSHADPTLQSATRTKITDFLTSRFLFTRGPSESPPWEQNVVVRCFDHEQD